MTDNILMEALAAVEQGNKEHLLSHLYWKTIAFDYIQSTFGCLQLYRYKSQTLLPAGTTVSNPLDAKFATSTKNGEGSLSSMLKI